jgi:hypothetical protein
VPGGGTALVYASRSLEGIKSKCENFDQTVGVSIIQKAIRMPAKTIADNAGGPSCSLLLCSLFLCSLFLPLRALCVCSCCQRAAGPSCLLSCHVPSCCQWAPSVFALAASGRALCVCSCCQRAPPMSAFATRAPFLNCCPCCQ